MLEYSYNAGLVLASIAISTMAAFTGLWLTRGISSMSAGHRQLRVAMASVALGDGIWSMHFTAMLAVTLPVPVTYDLLSTVASALVAILLSGLALLILHFGRRNRAHFLASGAMLGLGIVVMHYMGMSAMQLCQPSYSIVSIVAAALIAPVMGVTAIWTAFGRTGRRAMVLGTLLLGLSVVVVHFTAMAGTGFYQIASQTGLSPMLDNQMLALVVLLSAFVICGAFLLTGATFLTAASEAAPEAGIGSGSAGMAAPAVAQARPEPATAPQGAGAQPDAAPHAVAGHDGHVRLPIERHGHTEFVNDAEIVALRAEGHYTIVYCCEDKFFCSWSISEAEKRLAGQPFLRTHRSYLVNLAHVAGFERHRDGGVCLFSGVRLLDRVPVSRKRVAAIREALAI